MAEKGRVLPAITSSKTSVSEAANAFRTTSCGRKLSPPVQGRGLKRLKQSKEPPCNVPVLPATGSVTNLGELAATLNEDDEGWSAKQYLRENTKPESKKSGSALAAAVLQKMFGK